MMRVLIVDDEADSRDLTATVLERAGAATVTAATTHEAMAAVGSSRFDGIVTDIGMPVEDGFALLSQVRLHADEAVRRIPVVALTAYAAEPDRSRVLAAGFDGYLAKPVEPEDLTYAVSVAVTRTSQNS